MAWRWWGLLFVISSFGYGPENWDSVYEEFRAELYSEGTLNIGN